MMQIQNTKILIIDDEAPIRETLSASLKDEGYQVAVAADGLSGLAVLSTYKPDVVFLDIWMPHGNSAGESMDGIEVLTQAKKLYPEVEFVMISGHGTIETAVKSTKLGAWDFIEKPLSMDKILIVLSNILHYQGEKEEKMKLLNKLRKSIALVGDSAKMVAVKQFIAQTAADSNDVLLCGQNGVGKELTAQNIHYMSQRASLPFVDVNCSNIPEDLQELEIFGIEKGALPGIDKTRKGKLELAQKGTLFVDDISEMGLPTQARLLNYLKTETFSRQGSGEVLTDKVRLIAASTVDLQKKVEEKLFLPELYQWIKKQNINIPSLQDHAEDIPALVSHFSDQFARESGYPRKVFSEKSVEKMKSHSWPGNVRELKNFIERVYILTPGEFVDVHDLFFAGLVDAQEKSSTEGDWMSTFREARAKFEKEYLIHKINENGGNISKTAEVIGLERSYLHRKIKFYGIE
ncbi:MAG: sigma-54-dependent transcriptional regulator [Pseudobdellovibrionaceae bacterium]